MGGRWRAWARIVRAARTDRHLRVLGRHLVRRAHWHAINRYVDVPRYQLRALERAYSRSPAPDLLIFSDFNMDWVPRDDGDYRHLPDMIQDVLGGSVSCESVVGTMYNARITLAFLAAVAASRHKPRAIVVPLSTVTAQSLWLAHPVRGYAATAAQLRAMVGTRHSMRGSPATPAADELAAWDDLPLGADGNTAGKAQLIASSMPRTAVQRELWVRSLMTLYHSERLGPDSPGVLLTAELAAALRELKVAVVAVIPAVHCEYLDATLGTGAVETVKHNAELLRTTFLGSSAATAEVVDLSCASESGHFGDPVHLNAVGRYALATAVARVLEPHLA